MRDSRRTRTIVGLLLLVSLTLVVLSLRGGDSSRSGASGLFAPVENAAASIVAPVRNFFSSIGGIGSKDQQIADLQAKIVLNPAEGVAAGLAVEHEEDADGQHDAHRGRHD